MKEDTDFNEMLDEMENGVDEDIFETETVSVSQNDVNFDKVTDENVNDFILSYGAQLVKDGIHSIDRIKGAITSSQDAEEIKALSDMMKTVNATLGTLTKISIQNKKIKGETDVKQLEHTQRKELPDVPKTQVIVATREEIFKQMEEGELCDAEIEVIEDEV